MRFLFDTPEKKAQAAVDLQNLLSTPGWQIIAQILEENIKRLEDIILSTENESDSDKDKINEARKDRIRFIFFRDLPQTQVESLLNDTIFEDTADPYLTSSDIESKRS